MKLLEISQSPDHHQIKEWLHSQKIYHRYEITPTGTVNVKADVRLSFKNLESIPIQFETSWLFDCTGNHLASLKGCPTHTKGDFACAKNELTSLEYCPKQVDGSFICFENKFESLHNVHKHVKQIAGIFKCDLLPNMLGILLIRGVEEVRIAGFKNGTEAHSCKIVQDIFNKYLGTRDVHACQEELIDAGFSMLARL